MSGHSKWSTIKRKKGALDAKRGKIFSKLAKEISVAARMGGGDPDMNPRLRTVLLAAKAENMPKDNISRAIKKGTGDIEGAVYESQRFEGYGPAGAGLIIDTLTDNKNRTVANVRHTLNKYGGSMAETNAVSWNFEQKGLIVVEKEGLDDDTIFEKATDAGADDVDMEGDTYDIMTESTELHNVTTALEGMGITPKEAKLTMVPKTTVELEPKQLKTMLTLMEMLDDDEDVQEVFNNVELTDEAMEAAMAD